MFQFHYKYLPCLKPHRIRSTHCTVCTQKRNLLHLSFVLEFEWKKLDSKGIIYLSKMNFSISNSVSLKMCKSNHSKHISKFKRNPKNMIKCWNYCTTSNSATNAQENEKEISNNLMSFYFLWKKAQTLLQK